LALPDRLKGLLDERAYPHSCGRIELLETHISWVILTGEFAYKLKKPVSFNFVDFSSLDKRAFFCQEEVRCNRSFAPDLYLGVVGVVESPAGVAVEREAVEGVIEWAVMMKQFDPEMGLDRLLARGELSTDLLHDFGASLAERHAALPVHSGVVDEVPVRIFGPVEDNFSEIGNTGIAEVHEAILTQALSAARSLGERLRPQFDARMTGGAVRECHGDLHLSNLALVNGTVTAFDCLEFNENLRWIDTMSDVAFLFMDCHVRGRLDCAYAFLDGYLDASADYSGVRLLHYFSAYRSVVRAKVAALRWVQEAEASAGARQETAERFIQHLAWARDWLGRPPGQLLLTCGLSGSGKSHLAGMLVSRLPAVRLRSDVARKSLAGLAALADSQSPLDGGLYSNSMSERTFEYLAEVAGDLIRAGENVIVDATFIERSRRDEFIALAGSLGTVARILYCDASIEVMRERLAARSASGLDPSEATAEVLDYQLDRFEPPADAEPVIRVDTGTELTDQTLTELVRTLGG